MEWSDEQRERFALLMWSGRDRLDLKQYEVAEKLDMSPGTISQLERGPYVGMRWWDVTRLARFYHIPLDAIAAALGLDDSPEEVEYAEMFALSTGLGHLSPDELEEVRKVLRLLVRGMRAKE